MCVCPTVCPPAYPSVRRPVRFVRPPASRPACPVLYAVRLASCPLAARCASFSRRDGNGRVPVRGRFTLALGQKDGGGAKSVLWGEAGRGSSVLVVAVPCCVSRLQWLATSWQAHKQGTEGKGGATTAGQPANRGTGAEEGPANDRGGTTTQLGQLGWGAPEMSRAWAVGGGRSKTPKRRRREGRAASVRLACGWCAAVVRAAGLRASGASVWRAACRAGRGALLRGVASVQQRQRQLWAPMSARLGAVPRRRGRRRRRKKKMSAEAMVGTMLRWSWRRSEQRYQRL